MNRLASYVLPQSLAWWAGFISFCLGAAMVWLPGDPTLARLAIIWGAIVNIQDVGGIGFIAFGVMAIGVRAKLERALPEGWIVVNADGGSE